MIIIYQASTNNVRELKSKRRILNKMIKNAIKRGREDESSTLTQLYALLYSSFAETSFLKLIHTPHGFEETEISEIFCKSNLEEKWKKCFELAFKKIENSTNSGEVANKKRKLNSILQEYIIEPSEIRNKIAHGQWVKCLNGKCTNVNNDTTLEMKSLDFVKIDIYFEIYIMFEQCIEDLIESPYKAHYNNFYASITKLEEYIKRTRDWSYDSKRKLILESPKNVKYKQKNLNYV